MMEYFRNANARFIAVKAGTSNPQTHIGFKAKQENPKYRSDLNQPHYITVPRALCPTRAEPKIMTQERGVFKVTCPKCHEIIGNDPAYNKSTREFNIDYANKIYNEPVQVAAAKKTFIPSHKK